MCLLNYGSIPPGHILFDEFCNWAISKNLDLEDDDDDLADADNFTAQAQNVMQQQAVQMEAPVQATQAVG